MVEIKLETEEIVFRVVYAGPEGATKFTVMRALHDLLPDRETTPITVMHAGGDRVIGFRHRNPRGDRLFEMDVCLAPITIPGKLTSSANLSLLLMAADAVVFVPDRSDVNGFETKRAWQDLLRRLDEAHRKPGQLPLFVQLYGDATPPMMDAFDDPSHRWEAVMCPALECDDDILIPLDRARDRIVSYYKSYEDDLRAQGLNNHIRIHDRIFEKVAVQPWEERDARPLQDSEFRLLENLEGSRSPYESMIRKTLIAVCVLLVLTSAAAAYVAAKL